MRETFHSVLVLVTMLFFGVAEFCSGQNTSLSCIEGEREALLKFKLCSNVLSDMLSSWKGNDCCEWRGVGCDKNSGHVVSLILRRSKLGQSQLYLIDDVEEVVSGLLKLRYLEHLDLSGNKVNSRLIPPSFGLMKQLRYLNLSSMNFKGRIPCELGNLTRLRVLDLSDKFYRRLMVDDVQWISHLSSLQQLDMSGVNLSHASSNLFQVLGMLPSLTWLSLLRCSLKNSHLPSRNHPLNFTLLGNIQYLDLSRNFFQSPIPIFLQNMTSLIFLYLFRNGLSGNIPDSIMQISQLESIDLSHNQLSGSIPNSIRQLSKLESMNLSGNQLSGNIPDCIGQLSQLKSINLAYNQLSGSIPNSIKQLSKLESIRLQGNQLNGSILDSIGQLFELESINLSGNRLIGSVPDCIGQLSKLRILYLPGNQLSGSIPYSIGQLSKLELLCLAGNQLSGSIPDSIGQLSKLGRIYFSNNQLSGSIPDSIDQLSKLNWLDLSKNQLSGSIPDNIGQLSKLETIDLSRNQLSGSIPCSIGQLSKLRFIYLSNNQLSGSIPDCIGQLAKLESIDLSSNQLGTGFPKWLLLQNTTSMVDLSNASISGPLPKNIDHMMPMLQDLFLANNLMNGSIQKSLCNLKSLRMLDLSNNLFSGSIPNCWRNDQSVYFIDLSSNNLSGLFPSTMGQLSSLLVLHLDNNSLNGELNMALKTFTSLMVLDLGENKFSGNLTSIVDNKISKHALKVLRLQKNLVSGYIPLELCSLSRLQILDLADNNLTGRIPPCFGKFPSMVDASKMINRSTDGYWTWGHLKEVVKGRYLEYTRKTLGLQSSIDLSSNNLIGSIPEELIFLKDLHNLNLSWNHLSGNIPEKIGQMENLESLDFSKNGLSGTIPMSMSSLTKLSHLNLSYNNLSGPIPTGYQLQTLEDPSIYNGNPQLCGAPLLKKCSNDVQRPPIDNFKDNDEGELKRMWFYIVVMLGFATGFWGVVGTLIFVKTWRYAYFQWVDDVKHWILVVITLKMARFKKMFNSNPDDQ